VKNFKKPEKQSTIIFSTVFVFLVIFIFVMTYWFYTSQRENIIEENKDKLTSISNLESRQIAEYRKERLSEAKFIYRNETFINILKKLFQSQASKKHQNEVKDWLLPMMRNHKYIAVQIINPADKSLILSLGQHVENDEDFMKYIDESVKQDTIIFTNLLIHEISNKLHMEIFTPVEFRLANGNIVELSIIFSIDPFIDSFNLLGSIPYYSNTAEVLLVRKEENYITYLNEPRHSNYGLLGLRLPVDTPRLTAGMGFQGFSGITMGMDYRRKEVLANVTPLEDLDCILITKVDMDEIMMKLNDNMTVVFVLEFFLLLTMGVAFVLTWRSRNLYYYKLQYDSIDKIKKLNRTYVLLSRINELIIKNKNKDVLLKEISRVSTSVAGFALCFISSLNKESNQYKLKAYSSGIEQNYNIKIFLTNLMESCVDTDLVGKSIIINYLSDSFLDEKTKNELLNNGIMSLAIFEIDFSNETKGIIGFLSNHDNFFTHEEQMLLTGLSHNLSYSLINIENENRLLLTQFSVENSSISVFRIEEPEGRIVYANKKACESLGYTKEELYKLTVFDIDPIFTKEKWQKYKIEIKDKMTTVIESYHQRKDGTQFPVEVNINIRFYEGKEIVFSFVKDITETKRAEEELRKSEYRHRSTLENMKEGYQIIGFDWRYIYLNDSACKYGKYSREELIGHKVSEKYSGIEDTKLFKIMEKCMIDRESQKFEDKFIYPDGSVAWFYFSIEPAPEGIFILSLDISEEKEREFELIKAKEKAEKMSRIKSEFLALISHEIRTPLNVIVNAINLLKEELFDQVDDELKYILNSVTKSSDRLIRTIHLTLDMSELQLDTYEFQGKEMDLYEAIIKPVFSEMRAKADNENLELRIRKNTNNCNVFIDEYSVSQIFMNLIDNSIKYTEEGFIEISIDRDKNDHLTVEVEDTGIGIERSRVNKLFEPFTQVESGYTRRFEGTGLGLSIVKKYCEINNADISVTSKVNSGSIFRISFNQ